MSVRITVTSVTAALLLPCAALAQSDADLLAGIPGMEPEIEEPAPSADSDADLLAGIPDSEPVLADAAGGGGDADLLSGIPDSDYAADEAASGMLPAESDASVRLDQGLRWHLDTSVTGYDRRTPLPDPGNDPSTATGRARIVTEGGFALGPATTLRLNAALSGRIDSGDGFDFDDDARFDLREAFILHQTGNFTFQIGRINIRNGVAQGFNPTDFFRALNVDQSPNLDPGEARLNRLGVVAAQVGYLWDSGAASLTYTPEITGGSDWWHDRDVWGLRLNATNPRDRFLLSLTQEFGDGFSPEAFLFFDDGEVTGGLAGSVSIGDRWLAYAEMTHGQGRSILDSSLRQARRIGRLAPPIAAAYGDGDDKTGITQAALGMSYTSSTNLVATAEYHYNGAGFDDDDWDNYFDLARAVEGNRPASAQLASMFLYGAFRQEPLSKHSLFFRVAQNDLADGKMTVSGLSTVSLADGSGSAQVEAAYELSDDMILTGRLGGTFGGRETDFGSRSNQAFATVKMDFHF